MGDDGLLRDQVDALYGTPRDAFVAERDRRVKALRADGHREVAATLRGCRKPTVPAWAVDQLPRRHPEAVEALIDAATAVRDRQRRAASGRSAELREASTAYHERLRALRDLAAEVIAGAGSSPASHLDEVERTLAAAAADPQHHDTLRRGVFERPLAAAGFGPVAGLTLVPGTGPAAGEDQADVEDRADDGEAEAQAAREREEARLRRRRREALQRQRRDLGRARERQERRVTRTEREAGELQQRADNAAAQAREERTTLEEMDAELADLTAELDDLADA
jgi:hypothetical protein